MKPVTKCCICGIEFIGFGNNPWPVVTDYVSSCCDTCNSTKVIPARIKQMMENHSGTEQSK